MEQSSKSQSFASSRAGVFMQHVYSWMCIGLVVTAFVAYLVASTPALFQMTANPIVTIVLLVAMLGLAFYLPSRMHTLSGTTASTLFIVFSSIMGATLAPITMIYTQSSIFITFGITACMFGSLALYGMFTKRDLTAMGQFMMMGLIGIILAGIVNIFLQSSALQFMVNIFGVIIFAGLTAYDNQKIRQMGENAPLDDALAIRRGSILGAFTLYLDFINLFLMLLRFFGQTRD